MLPNFAEALDVKKAPKIAIICISIVFMILIGTSVIKIENKNTRNDVGLGIGIGGIFLPIVFGFVYTFA